MTHHGAKIEAIRTAAIAALAVVVAAGGCRLVRRGAGVVGSGPTAPVLIQTGATASQIVAAVNQNTTRVQSYTATNASFSMPGMPGLPMLKGDIVLERPKRFRLRAGTALTGGEVDLGSNDDLFWLWAKRNDPPAVYFARHDQHASGAARQLLPIDPAWVIDALGLVTLDPNATYQGPLPRSDGSLELRHTAVGPNGPVQRVTVIDPTRAWVTEQHVYDGSGAVIASAVAEDFRFEPTQQVSLPRQVTIRVPNADLALTIKTGVVAVNAPIANPAQHWTLPYIDGTPQVDLGLSDGLPGLAASSPGANSQLAQPLRTSQRLPAGGVALPPRRRQ
ncbi:MAG: hypothetical protein AAF589_00085 [Planctomycetota bacterium]